MTLHSGAEIFVKCLQAEGVDLLFGYPGGTVIDIYHELDQSNIRHILVRHEQAAIHAADGYARVAKKPGVALVTSGPGATNTVTGIASAYMDSIPVVVFTGQVPTPLIGNDSFQEVDIVGITRSCTKHNFLVKSSKDLIDCIARAFYLARSGRPGPVLVDLPKDIIQAREEFTYPKSVRIESYQPKYQPHLGQLRKAFDMLRQAKRPLVYGGGGIVSAGASGELTRFARKLSIPVTLTLMGLGAIPGDDPLWLGMLGMHGTYTANMAVAHCDLLLAIGARFDDRVTGKLEQFAPNAKIVHIDIDPTSIQKNVPVDVPVVGDCRRALQALERFSEQLNSIDWGKKHATWLGMIEEWKRTGPLAYEQTPGGDIKPQFVVDTIHKLTAGNAIVSTEVGQNQMWTAQYYHFNSPNSFVTSGGLGCMGYGLPAAIGAQLARPDRVVIDIAGDGSIQMNIQELATAVQHNVPVKIAILNNRYLGMVRQWQELFKDRRYASTDMDSSPDFVRLAEAYGAVGIRATRPDEVEPALKEALAVNRPVLIDFWVEREENVYPMVPAGEPLTNMLLVQP
jgi:acetolactate synthase I/II/III large subunit